MSETAAKGLVVAALRSSSGKTTVTLGAMRALARRGLAVAGAKCGPDYIDPAFHAAATGRPSLNLDSWAMSPALLGDLARGAAAGADLVLVEGLMGLFDGVPAEPGRTGSSADVARAIGLPVVLVHDVSGQSQSAAAIVAGVRAYAPDLPLAGVILNRVGSARHTRLVSDAIADLGIEVFGAIPRTADIAVPERHLGLVQASETQGLDALLDRMADLVEAGVDLDRLAAAARPMTVPVEPAVGRLPPPGRRIAIAHDAAFGFLYPHLVAGWRAAGAEIVFFSPLAD
jgi:cobyrinic acid a,c-diamide synthase